MFGDVLFRVLCSGDFLNFLLDTEVQCIFGRGGFAIVIGDSGPIRESLGF